MTNKITIIGYGKMAQAIACAINGIFELEIAGRNSDKIQHFIQKNNLKNATAIHIDKSFDVCDKIIILAIKPYALHSFIYNNVAHSVFSVMAGINIKSLQQTINAQHYCRVMPNIASLVKKGVNAIYTNDFSTHELADKIFAHTGINIFVEKESDINAACAISGSGTAYLALIAEALIDAGVREGLHLDTSKKLVNGLFNGFSTLLDSTNPSNIKESTTSPGGTTAEALSVLEAHSIRAAFINAVHSARTKADNICK